MRCEMKKLFTTVLIAWMGYWIGANRWLPLWMIALLAVAGIVCWLVAEWMELAEGNSDDES